MSCLNITVQYLSLVGKDLRMWPFQIMICNRKLSFYILKMYKEDEEEAGEGGGKRKRRRGRRRRK